MEIGKYSAGLGEICTILRSAVGEALEKAVRISILLVVEVLGCSRSRTTRKPSSQEKWGFISSRNYWGYGMEKALLGSPGAVQRSYLIGSP